MNKIKEIIKKIKKFNMFKYILGKKIESLTKDYDTNGELIDMYTNNIKGWTIVINTTKDTIISLIKKNEMIKDKIKDINKIK